MLAESALCAAQTVRIVGRSQMAPRNKTKNFQEQVDDVDRVWE